MASKVVCPNCDKEMDIGKLWKRRSTKIFCGTPGVASEVKETIEYERRYICHSCGHKEWINDYNDMIDVSLDWP